MILPNPRYGLRSLWAWLRFRTRRGRRIFYRVGRDAVNRRITGVQVANYGAEPLGGAIPSTVSSITLVAGGATVHVTVVDESGIPLPPASITWAPVVGITIAADATGFMFSAASAVAAGTLTTEAVYTGALAAVPVKGPTLSLVVIDGVTALQYLSP
jgi:hypothetical protein